MENTSPSEISIKLNKLEAANNSLNEVELLENKDDRDEIPSNEVQHTNADNINLPSQTSNDTWKNLIWVATKVYTCLEMIGEAVANVIGLNDSKYQWVIDSMDEDDWRIAKEVQSRRIAEDIERDAGIVNDSLECGDSAFGVTESKTKL